MSPSKKACFFEKEEQRSGVDVRRQAGGTKRSLLRRSGGDERDRTADPLLAKQVLSRLSYTPIMVGPSGLEPPTSRLSVVRSNQLSYGPSLHPLN